LSPALTLPVHLRLLLNRMALICVNDGRLDIR
jgi:hypothetical protein